MSVLRDRIEELLFRLRRDDERMNAQLSSGLSGIFASNAIAREDVTKALESMLPLLDTPRKVRVTFYEGIFGMRKVVELPVGDGQTYQVGTSIGAAYVKADWA